MTIRSSAEMTATIYGSIGYLCDIRLIDKPLKLSDKLANNKRWQRGSNICVELKFLCDLFS